MFLDCVLSCVLVFLLNLLIERGDIRAQLVGRNNFLRLDVLSSMHIDQVSLIYFVCSIYFDNLCQTMFSLALKCVCQ